MKQKKNSEQNDKYIPKYIHLILVYYYRLLVVAFNFKYTDNTYFPT